jgi:hypothetical protein
MRIWLSAPAKHHESPSKSLSKILKNSANTTLSHKTHTALPRLGTPSPKFSRIRETHRRRREILTVLNRLQIRPQFGPAQLGHNTFTQPAVDLIVRSADGVLRKARNLCVSCLIEAVRSANRTIDIDYVNRVLMQPHWQTQTDVVDY